MSKGTEKALTDPIPKTRFSTCRLPSNDRFGIWRDKLRPLVDVTLPAVSSQASFGSTVDAFNLDNVVYLDARHTPQHYERKSTFKIDHGVQPFMLRLYLSGDCHGSNGGVSSRVRPGDIVFLDPAEDERLDVTQAHILGLTIPREIMARHARLDDVSSGRGVIRRETPTGRILGHCMRTVWQQLPRATIADTNPINHMMLGCITGIFAGVNRHDEQVAPAFDKANLEYALACVDRHLSEPGLDVNHLCRHLGCSRAQLQRLFQPLGGVACHIRKMRLARCRQELIESGGTPARLRDISERWGFVNYSCFCRLFRETFGMTPQQAVEQSRATRQVSSVGQAAGRDALFNWLFD